MLNLTVPRIIRSLITLQLIIIPVEIFLTFEDIFLSKEVQKIAEDAPSLFDSWSLNGLYFLLSIFVLDYLLQIISLIGLFFFKDWARWAISLWLVLEVFFCFIYFFLIPRETFIESAASYSVTALGGLLMGAIVTIIWLSPKLVASKASIKE
jgi:hypothetical protein